MNKALDYFEHMVHCDQLERDGEKPKCDLIRKQLKALEIIKKHFNIKIKEAVELNGNIWARFVSIQSKEDEDTWNTTACANLVDYKEDFDLLKEVLDDEDAII